MNPANHRFELQWFETQPIENYSTDSLIETVSLPNANETRKDLHAARAICLKYMILWIRLLLFRKRLKLKFVRYGDSGITRSSLVGWETSFEEDQQTRGSEKPFTWKSPDPNRRRIINSLSLLQLLTIMKYLTLSEHKKNVTHSSTQYTYEHIRYKHIHQRVGISSTEKCDIDILYLHENEKSRTKR
jgi:hypothetical protein